MKEKTARKLGQIEHFKRKNALLSEENSNLNARLQECETVKAHNQQLLVDNDNLQKRNKDLWELKIWLNWLKLRDYQQRIACCGDCSNLTIVAGINQIEVPIRKKK